MQVAKDRSMQDNICDCGIFVYKYVDYYVRGDIDITKVRWLVQDVTVFRYRITHELYKFRARDIPADVLYPN